MYQCQNVGCKYITKPGTSMITMIAEKREKTYENMVKRPRIITKKIFIGGGKTKIIKKEVKNRGKNAKMMKKISNGWEIAKEIRVCPLCAKKLGLDKIQVEVKPVVQRQRYEYVAPEDRKPTYYPKPKWKDRKPSPNYKGNRPFGGHNKSTLKDVFPNNVKQNLPKQNPNQR